MKTFKRRSLPDFIIYNGKKYIKDPGLSTRLLLKNKSIRSLEVDLRLMNKKGVMVECLQRSLEGRKDLYNSLYKPTQHLYIYNHE